MLVCERPTFVPWRPDFSSSEQPSPEWTRLLCGDEQLTNALGGVDWRESDRFVQVELCESCGTPGCEPGGYVRVSRLGRHVLWTHPHVDPDDPFDAYQVRPSEPVRRHGAIAFPSEKWNAWCRRFDGVPPATSFPPTARRDLLAAWDADRPDAGDPIAADPLGLADATAGIGTVARWLSADPDAAVDGELVAVATLDAPTDTVYFDVPDAFDRPRLCEWRALARIAGKPSPLFGDLVLVPPPE